MKTKESKEQVILHGECMVFPSVLPEGAQPIKPSHVNYHVVAPSETTGNDHVVDTGQGVQFYQSGGGTLLMQNSKPTQIRCLHKDRHDAITLEPGTHEFGSQQEYDYFEEALRNVRD